MSLNSTVSKLYPFAINYYITTAETNLLNKLTAVLSSQKSISLFTADTVKYFVSRTTVVLVHVATPNVRIPLFVLKE